MKKTFAKFYGLVALLALVVGSSDVMAKGDWWFNAIAENSDYAISLYTGNYKQCEAIALRYAKKKNKRFTYVECSRKPLPHASQIVFPPKSH